MRKWLTLSDGIQENIKTYKPNCMGEVAPKMLW
jgi:hypothetical protein